MVPGGCLGSVRMYQLAALIEAVPRISLSRCTIKMHQRPTLWPTQRMSHQNVRSGCHWNCHWVTFRWAAHGPAPVPTYIYTCCYTDWIGTLVTNISYLLWHLNGSLTCPPAVPHRHAFYGSREVTDMRQLCTAGNPNSPTHPALGTLYEACRGFVSYRF